MNIPVNEAQRRYMSFDPRVGYPAGSRLFYECRRCGEVLPSQPNDSEHCKCRNIMIDVDYGRFSVEDPTHVRLFEVDETAA